MTNDGAVDAVRFATRMYETTSMAALDVVRAEINAYFKTDVEFHKIWGPWLRDCRDGQILRLTPEKIEYTTAELEWQRKQEAKNVTA